MADTITVHANHYNRDGIAYQQLVGFINKSQFQHLKTAGANSEERR